MEDSQSRSLRGDFPLRWTSPPKSQTLRTLSRILSMFDDRNQPPRLVKFVPFQLSPGSLTLDDFVSDGFVENTQPVIEDHSKMGDADDEKNEHFSKGKGRALDVNSKGAGLFERELNETEMALNEIAGILSIDEDDSGDSSNPKEEDIAESSGVVNLEACNREQMIVDELKAIVSGDFAPIQDNCSVTSNGFATQPKDCKEINRSIFRNNISGAEVAMEHKDSVGFGDGVVAPNLIVVNENMEEGELPDGSGFEIEVAVDKQSEIPQLPEEQLGKGNLFEATVQGVDVSSLASNACADNINDREVKIKEIGVGYVIRRDALDVNRNEKHVEAQGVDISDDYMGDIKIDLQRRAEEEARISSFRPKDLVFYGDILDENEIAEEGLTSGKRDIDVNKKRKRGPCSKEHKERKKAKERKKRAQKNRELGVKRLKLQPVQMPKKTVRVCRHYMSRKCREGENCKFSHDATPLPKSKPCGHFARHSCMNGDDCPLDHQLSKYPCRNFVSKGVCSRGDNCLFSHKILPKEDSASGKTNSSRPDPGALSTPGDASAKKGMEMDSVSRRAAGAVLESLGISFKSRNKMIMSSLGKAQVQKSNVDSYPVQDVAVASPKKSGQVNTSSEKEDEGRLNIPTKESSSSCSLEKTREIVKTPTVVPKGINFLSFGRSSTGTPNTGLPKSDSTITDKGVKAISRTDQNLSGVVFGLNGMATTKVQSLVGSQEISNTGKQATTSSRVNNAADRSDKEGQTNEHQNSSSKSSTLPTFMVTSRLQAGSSTPSPYKSILTSAQKVLCSTLAFAARCEKEMAMKKNRSAGDHVKPS